MGSGGWFGMAAEEEEAAAPADSACAAAIDALIVAVAWALLLLLLTAPLGALAVDALDTAAPPPAAGAAAAAAAATNEAYTSVGKTRSELICDVKNFLDQKIFPYLPACTLCAAVARYAVAGATPRACPFGSSQSRQNWATLVRSGRWTRRCAAERARQAWSPHRSHGQIWSDRPRAAAHFPWPAIEKMYKFKAHSLRSVTNFVQTHSSKPKKIFQWFYHNQMTFDEGLRSPNIGSRSTLPKI